MIGLVAVCPQSLTCCSSTYSLRRAVAASSKPKHIIPTHPIQSHPITSISSGGPSSSAQDPAISSPLRQSVCWQLMQIAALWVSALGSRSRVMWLIDLLALLTFRQHSEWLSEWVCHWHSVLATCHLALGTAHRFWHRKSEPAIGGHHPGPRPL